MEDVIELKYVRYVGHLGDMGGVEDVRSWDRDLFNSVSHKGY